MEGIRCAGFQLVPERRASGRPVARVVVSKNGVDIVFITIVSLRTNSKPSNMLYIQEYDVFWDIRGIVNLKSHTATTTISGYCAI